MHHGARGRNKIGFVDAVAFFLSRDQGHDRIAHFPVVGAAAQDGCQVMIFLTEKAGAKLPVGGEADARAMATERLGDGRDQADFTAAVRKAMRAS